jgi:UDP-GlcNAc:undecaprenyl-phosphate GlcNAc-1-phosphate transferase
MWIFYGWIVLSFLLGLFGTWGFLLLARRTGLFMDGTGKRKLHNGKIPRGAGVVFYIPFLIWALLDSNGYRWLLVPGTILLALGVVDDLLGMKAWIKLGVQVLVAAITWFLGFKVTSLALGIFAIPLPEPAGFIFTVFFMVGMMNAFNLVDGLDGLAGSLAIVAFVAIAYLGQVAGHQIIWWGALMMAAVVAGFLFLNSPPARVFMGDMGSHFVGYIIALMTINVMNTDSGFLVIPAILVAVFPIMDTFFAIIRRARRRAHLFGADRDHLHHRLLIALKNMRGVVFTLLGMSAACCILAVITACWPWLSLPVGSAVFVAIMTWGIFTRAV